MMDADAAWQFLGRLHPVVLHLPFGVFAALLLIELRRRGDSRLVRSLLADLLAVSTVVAAATGWRLGGASGSSDELLELHRWCGVALACTSLLIVVFCRRNSRGPYFTLMVVYGLLLVPTGHLGGSMTHGEDFLFGRPVREPSPSIAPEHALLQSRCGACHGERRQRGDFSVATMAELTKAAVVPDDPAGSELVRRLRLPLDDRKHMPPRTKKQLTSDEITAIERWIAVGLPAGGSAAAEKVSVETARSVVKPEPLTAEEERHVEALRRSRCHVEVLDPASRRLFVRVRTGADAAGLVAQSLRGLRVRVEALSMRRAELSPELIAVLPELIHLKELDLAFTGVSDDLLSSLSTLAKLETLDLTGTTVTDAAIPTLAAWSSLCVVRVWGAQITSGGVATLRRDAIDLTVVDGADIRSEPVETEPPFTLEEREGEHLRMGRLAHRYEWTPLWFKLPEGQELGHTHGGIVVDRKGHIHFNTDTDRAVMVFDATGRFLRSWGAELGAGAHGMQLVEEDGEEFLYIAHTAQHVVAKATLDGEILWRLGPPMESGHYENESQFLPTSVAVAPDGGLFVADGYGQNVVHRYDADRKWVRSFGGRGKELGRFETPHGLWIDTRGAAPELLVADRENARLQRFDMNGKPLGEIRGMFRRPCQIHQHGEDLVVSDLGGRVTILDRENQKVTHLGDNPDPTRRANFEVAREDWNDGEFLAPHCAVWDAEGNLYVMDWIRHGRVTRLTRLRD